MNEQQSQKVYERALDASMVVALGKLYLFRQCWHYMSNRARRKYRQKKIENLRIALRERINSLPDELFFVPPDMATSEDEVKDFLQKRFENEKLPTKILEELKKRIESSEPGLAEFI
jgi:hypothetical protein